MKYKKGTLSPFCLKEMPYINKLHEWAKQNDISVIQNTEKINLFLKNRKKTKQLICSFDNDYFFPFQQYIKVCIKYSFYCKIYCSNLYWKEINELLF